MKRTARPRSSTFVPRLRRSQIISTFGPGAIIDTIYDSATIKGLDQWPNPKTEDRIHDERLQGTLHVEFLYQPPPYVPDAREDRLPIIKFPKYHHCPKCHQLTDDFQVRERRLDGVYCTACRQVRMVPARFIAACSAGHAQDFPFREWAHGGLTACNEQLSMRTSGRSSGLRDINIRCDCGEGRAMEGAFSEDAFSKIGVGCSGGHPWRATASSFCQENLRALQRGASNFYFSETVSSLSVPPWEGRLAELVRRFRALFGGNYPDPGNATHVLMLREVLKQNEYSGLRVEDVLDWVKKANQAQQTPRDQHAFKMEEFGAFVREVSSDTDWPRFSVRSAEVAKELSPFVAQVVLADVLEEVRALIGFRRIDPWSPDPSDPMGNLVSVREPAVNWLPGVRLTGEGIFIRFHPQPLDHWAADPDVVARCRRLEDMVLARAKSGKSRPLIPSPRLLFLHTFSHVVMRQLSLECGYSSGAIRERVFAGYSARAEEREVGGVLIYTGSTDSEGTLGGLVSMGEGETLWRVVRRAVREAAWCSSDPICSETRNTGERTMNLSACHACLFAPETSCEFYNSLLDRQTIVGDLDGRGGFLSTLI
jgi:hypothetical protein